MPDPAASETFEGVALHDQFGLDWESAPIDNLMLLEHCNQEAARILQAIAVFEEAPREVSTDSGQIEYELMHLEAKTDVLLSLVGMLVAANQTPADPHTVVMRANSVEWTGRAADSIQRGDTGFITLFVNPQMPLALRLPASIVGSTERNGRRWLLTQFEGLGPAVQEGMEKLIFRRHRRQIALARGTGVHSETGIFAAPRK